MSIDDIRARVLKGEAITLECKKAENELPRSVWETYSAFANTFGGLILLGVSEHAEETDPAKRFTFDGVGDPVKIIKEFWDTINSNKVNVNVLSSNQMKVFDSDGRTIISIEVPQADCSVKPVYLNGNMFSGSYKRNYQGDYHCTKEEVHQMVRDSYADGNDGRVFKWLTMDDIDLETLHKYMRDFEFHNPDHVWNDIKDDKVFLKVLGGYGFDPETEREGLTAAGLMMFGKGVPISDVFANFRLDYLDMSHLKGDQRYSDRLTYDGRWENNFYNFMHIVLPKLTFDMPRPFQMPDGIHRIDDTIQMAAVREAFTNSIIHCDIFSDAGVLRIEKHDDFLVLRNPGILKLPVEQVYEGGVSSARNPRIQKMLRLIGLGETAGSGIPKIMHAWKEAGWMRPELINNLQLNEVRLKLPIRSAEDMKRHYGIAGRKPSKGGTVAGRDSSESKAEQLEKDILSIIRKSPAISRGSISRLVGKAPSTVQRYTDKLKLEGRIRRFGGDKGGYWRVYD